MPNDNFGKPYSSFPPVPKAPAVPTDTGPPVPVSLPPELPKEAPPEPPSISVSPSMPVFDSEQPNVSAAPDNVYVADVLPKRSPVMAPKLDDSLGYDKYPSVAPAPVDLFPPEAATGMRATVVGAEGVAQDTTTRLNNLDWQIHELKIEIEKLKNKSLLQRCITWFVGDSNA